MFRPELISQSTRLPNYRRRPHHQFRPELISQSTRLYTLLLDELYASSGQSSYPNRLDSCAHSASVADCSGQSSYPNRLDCFCKNRLPALRSGQSSYPNRLDSAGAATHAGGQFRPELISQSTRLQATKSTKTTGFRPELISQSTRLLSRYLQKSGEFRPELISQSTRLPLVIIWY